MEKKIVIARLKLKDERVKDFLELTKDLIAQTRKEPGNDLYNLYQMPGDPSEFIFYEEYKDEASVAAHKTNDHYKAFSEGVKPMLAQPMNVSVF